MSCISLAAGNSFIYLHVLFICSFIYLHLFIICMCFFIFSILLNMSIKKTSFHED